MNKIIEVSIGNDNELIKKEKFEYIDNQIKSVNIHSILVFTAVIVIDCILLGMLML